MEILTDAAHRIAYATDASAYREMPLGVAYPQTEDDILWLLNQARLRHTHLIPRAAGTSIAGQVVGNGIVMEISRYMNRIVEVNSAQQWVRVQPGVVRDELNAYLKPYGLFFSPETSTSNRCCIGGMVGNNSCGTHSLLYGATRHHVVALRCILADGSMVEWHRDKTPNLDETPLQKAIQTQLQALRPHRQTIIDAFPDPSLQRRSCGYALDECLTDTGLNLPALITGSEGTLAIVTEITLSLDPLPPSEKMVVCIHLDDLDKSWEANLIALQHHPAAVELMDGEILQLSKGNIEAQKNRFFVQGDPQALVIVEFWGQSREQIDAMAAALEADITKWQKGQAVITRVYGADVARVWALRKAGLGVLSGMEGDAKPVGVIEDTAVSPERLGAYMHDFRAMMYSLGLSCVYYGHISTGELHLRPILNLKDPHDRQLFRQVATRTAELVKKHHGSLSGEHGDGRLRGEFIPLMYGEDCYQMMRDVKHAFDPEGLLNIHKIIDTPPMDEFLRYEINQPTTDLLRRVERCNGAGDCRKSNLMGGTMCPAYKVSGDEMMTTRARANLIREYLHTGTGKEQVLQVLSSCLACKGCKSECPSNVDMTRIRSEILQQFYDSSHTPFRSWMVARMAMVERLGSMVPHLYNAFATCPITSALIKRMVGFTPHRHIPPLSIVKKSKVESPKTGRRVYVFLDEFTHYQEAELGQKFVDLLSRLGYDVIIPNLSESGRAAISKGCLHLAAQYANKNVEKIKGLITDQTPLVGIEPSCILSFRDEYPNLVREELKADAKQLAPNCLLYDEFLLREIQNGHIAPDAFLPLPGGENHIILHGHCHQKALVGVEKTAQVLRAIPGMQVEVLPTGCCGMAGSFGYEKEHYATSMAIGEMVLFPAVRQSQQGPEPVIVCAPGTSCRQQIWGGTGVKAYHPLEVLYHSLRPKDGDLK